MCGQQAGQASPSAARLHLYSSSKLSPLALWLLISWMALSSSCQVLSAGTKRQDGEGRRCKALKRVHRLRHTAKKAVQPFLHGLGACKAGETT